MKKIFSLAFTFMMFSLTLISCKNDNDDSNEEVKYYIKAKMNGETRVFNYRYGIGKSKNSQGQITSISMSFSENNPKDNMYPALFLKINEPEGAQGSQQNITITPRTFDEPNDNVIAEFYKTSSPGDNFTSKIHTQNNFYMTITEFGKSVKGTFKGTLENQAGDKIIIENGEFYSPVAE
ncbi:hypothetical protein [Chryseobacterium populi]|uniref:Lipoprotein n=1 Tax=Chryseobacterium populi TaxID=1144316 RepID=J2SRG0_9FLAO|nr:hypothetical protein [Chryseobacterium populi]EJL68127.1 hypothetical protein PMI13_03882 [Chryseobacterium populi]